MIEDRSEERSALLAERKALLRRRGDHPVGRLARTMVSLAEFRMREPGCERAQRQAEINAANMQRTVQHGPRVVVGTYHDDLGAELAASRNSQRSG